MNRHDDLPPTPGGWLNDEARAEAEAQWDAFPPVEAAWPDGEPPRESIVVPGAYVALFRRDVEDERRTHHQIAYAASESDVDRAESARIRWAMDAILAQLPSKSERRDVDVLVPVHADGSGRLFDWLRDLNFLPSTVVDGLWSARGEERRAGMEVARAWQAVLDQLDELNARATA